MILVLNNDEIRSLLDMRLCMEALEEAYKASALGQAVNRVKTHIWSPTSRPDRFHRFKTFDGSLLPYGVVALRINSDILSYREVQGVLREEKLPAAGGERYVGLTILFSIENGEPIAIIPEGYIQRMRVGGSCGLSSKYMARKNAETLGLIGSGWQAGAQVLAHSLARPLKLIKVYSPNPDHRKRFAEEMDRQVEARVVAVNSAEEAAQDADILASATNSRDPTVQGNLVQPGMHLSTIAGGLDHDAFLKVDRMCQRDRVANNENSLNVYMGHVQERLPKRSRKTHGGKFGAGGLYSDHSRYREIGEIPSLGEIIAGHVPGRESDKEVTFFYSNSGVGIEFASVGWKVCQAAKKKGVGRELPTEWFTQKERP